MKTDIIKLRQLIKTAKGLITSESRFDKSRDNLQNFDLSQKARDNARNKMETEAEHIEDQLHELHCLAVDLGVADPDHSRYGEKIITSSNGWSELKKIRKTPESLKPPSPAMQNFLNSSSAGPNTKDQ